MLKDNIVVEGRTGTWYVVDTAEVVGRTFYILESEQHGDEADWIVINANGIEQNEEFSQEIKDM